MKKILFLLSFVCFSVSAISQDETPDSIYTLSTVSVKAFGLEARQLFSPIAVSRIDASTGRFFSKVSMVSGINSIAGVRMEERSPGSYRLNIRGSSLRSPFGVRNIKVYWNDIPVTDPGGNTYFNQFAWNNFSGMEIFKGPAGSMYGAGTGGLVLLNNFERWEPGISAEYNTGSYGLHNVFATAHIGNDHAKHIVTYAHNQSDGYRVQTKMRRDNFSLTSQLKKTPRHELTASLLFTDLYYQTPGALNLNEFKADPRAARPAGGGFPSAVNARAAIDQKTIITGFTNQFNFSSKIRNVTTLYGSFAQVKNSAIRNYERRNEPSFGGRSYFRFKKKSDKTDWELTAGGEFQQGYFNTQVAKNLNGNPDTLQTNDDINNTTYNLFTQLKAEAGRWVVIGGLSLTKTSLSFRRLSSYPVLTQKRSYRNELAPRISVMKMISTQFSVLASASRGFSPPTIAEVLPSTGVISTELEAENGWNYEATMRYSLLNRRLNIELTGFLFKLNNALVQRRDLSGADFFVNAGDVRQKGIELHTEYLNNIKRSLLTYIRFETDLTLNHFRYGSFVKGTDDFSGKKVPSVPGTTLAMLLDLQFKKGFYLNANHYYASEIYLNDANTAVADPYHLLGARVGWKKTLKYQHTIGLYLGADNLLDETYSLGNDINAAGGRYYNAAPLRNYYAGISFQWNKKTLSN